MGHWIFGTEAMLPAYSGWGSAKKGYWYDESAQENA